MVQKVGDRVGPIDFSDPFANNPVTTSGLTWGYVGGEILKEGTLTVISNGTLALSDGSTNIVYIDYSGTPALATTTISTKPAQGSSVFLWIITTSAGQIIDSIDLRNWTTSQVTT